MTARTVTGKTVLPSGSAQTSQTVTFVKRSTTISGITVTQASPPITATTNSSGEFSASLDCPADGSTQWTIIYPDGGEFDFTLPYGDGSSVAVTTLISAATVDADAVTLLLDGYEPDLGNPGTSGHVLSSTTAGVRSWVAQSGGSATWGSITGTITDQSDFVTYTENLLYPLGQITGVTAGNYPRVSASASNPLEERTPAQVLSDIGAQAADSDLTAIAALSPSNDDIIQRKAGAWTNRTMAQLLTDVGAQPLDSTLTSIAALGTAADKVAYTTGIDTWAETALTSFARTILDDTDAGTVRTTIGAGTGSGDLLAANNLSDVTASTARTNLAVPGLAVANTFTTLQTVRVEDAATNTVTNLAILNHRSSGTPAASFGAGVSFLLETSTTEDQDAAAIEAYWASATHASRVGVLNLSAYYIGTKTSLQVYPSSTGIYARLVWGSNSDQGLWRESNEQVISGASIGLKSFNGSAYVFSARVDGNTTAGNTRLLIYDVDNGTLERVSVGAADSGGAGYKVLRIPN